MGFGHAKRIFFYLYIMSNRSEDITKLLDDISSGDKSAWRKLFSLVYSELHALAHREMRKENPEHILQTTALVNEAYIRLVKEKDDRWKNRTHFFSVAARAMRQILVDEARKQKAKKRGYGQFHLSLDELDGVDQKIASQKKSLLDFEALDQALNKLESDEKNKRKCTIVEMHFFIGMTYEEIADVLGISIKTVTRDWNYIKLRLYQEMTKDIDR